MSNQILVPSLGESITEATVSKWFKQIGEQVNSDEPLVELETDKVNIEVPSPLSGTLSSIKVKEGSTVEVGSLLGVVQEGKSTKIKSPEPKLEEEIQDADAPLKTINKKQKLKKIVKTSQEKVKPMKLAEEIQEENKNGALILDTLVDNENENLEPVEKKYIPHLEDIASYLISKRIYLAGIDMINKFITEINITSPTGLMHLQQKDKNIFEKIAHQFISVITHYHDE